VTDTNTNPPELGLRFTVSRPGRIRGVRFYKWESDDGAHKGSLWSSAGALLTSIDFTGETASGWQEMRFTTPITLSAGYTYSVSIYFSSKKYYQNKDYFTSSTIKNYVTAVNGCYVYSAASAYPLNSSGSLRNYWIDLVFDPEPLRGNM
jgi:hypothetical protein